MQSILSPSSRGAAIATLALALLSAGPAVARAQPGVPSSRVLTARRFVADSFWTRTWYRGGTKDPELFTEPRQVVTVNDLVVVLDVGLREVSGFDAKSGAQRFTLTARGEGPGEFRRPALLVSTENGFAVLDHATSRLTAFDATGRMTWDTPITGAAGIEGLCLAPAGRILAKHMGGLKSLISMDSSGRTSATRSLPWRDPGEKSLAMSGFLAGPDSRGNCVLARRFGSEWLLITPTGATTKRPYVSAHPEATIVVKNTAKQRIGNEGSFTRTQFNSVDAAVSNLMLRGDTAIMRGGPAERGGYQLLDYYSLPTGRYIHSRRLPTIFITTAIGADGAFYGTNIGEESGALVAFRPSATRPLPTPKPSPNPTPSTNKPVEQQPVARQSGS